MIKSKKELLEYIAQDSKNFKRQLARGGEMYDKSAIQSN